MSDSTGKDMPEECSRCGYSTPRLEHYPPGPHPPFDRDEWLCTICACLAVNPDSLHEVLHSIAKASNVVIDALGGPYDDAPALDALDLLVDALRDGRVDVGGDLWRVVKYEYALGKSIDLLKKHERYES